MTSGSYLALRHITGDYQRPEAVAQWTEVFGGMAEPMVPRTHEQIGRFFDGSNASMLANRGWAPDW